MLLIPVEPTVCLVFVNAVSVTTLDLPHQENELQMCKGQENLPY